MVTSRLSGNCLGRRSRRVGAHPQRYRLQVNQGGSLKKTLFNGALTIKKNNIPILSSVVDAVVFKQVKEQTGGRLRFALSGGAALSRDTQEFLNTSLVSLLQGYGMTESCGMTSILTPEFYKYGTSGGIVPAIECKLAMFLMPVTLPPMTLLRVKCLFAALP